MRDGRRAVPDSHEHVPIQVGTTKATITAPLDVARTLRHTLRDLVRPAEGDHGRDIRVIRRGSGFRVLLDGERWTRRSDFTVIDQVVYLTMWLGGDAPIVNLHAGYVSWEGRGVLVAGTTGRGKSTLVALLVEAGFGYLTDELVGLTRSLELMTYPKPLSVVRGSFERLAAFDPARTGIGAASDEVWHVPATAIRADALAGDVALAAALFVEHRNGSTGAVHDIHAADAVYRLLGDGRDLASHGATAVDVVARALSGVRCVRLTYGETDVAVNLVRDVARSAAPPTLDVARLTLRGGVAPRTRRRRPRNARSVTINAIIAPVAGLEGSVVGGRALVWDARRARLASLNEVATAWLQLVDGKEPLAALVDAVADVGGTPRAVVERQALSAIEGLTGEGFVVVD